MHVGHGDAQAAEWKHLAGACDAVGTGGTPDLPPSPISALGKPVYLHIGGEVDGVDMRAEVGLLSRNIVIMGEMEDECYPYTNHICNFFNFDTFGGHIKVRVCWAGLRPNQETSHNASLWAGVLGRGADGGAGPGPREEYLLETGEVLRIIHRHLVWPDNTWQ